MVKADLGLKRVCPSCGARFYDLQKRPIECPKCSFSFEPESLYKQRRPRQPDAVAAQVVPADAEDEDADNEDEENEDAEEIVEEIPDEAPLNVAATSEDDDEEEEAVEDNETEGPGMKIVDEDDIEDIEVEDDEDEEDNSLLEDDEDENDDVSGIIDADIEKDER